MHVRGAVRTSRLRIAAGSSSSATSVRLRPSECMLTCRDMRAQSGAHGANGCTFGVLFVQAVYQASPAQAPPPPLSASAIDMLRMLTCCDMERTTARALHVPWEPIHIRDALWCWLVLGVHSTAASAWGVKAHLCRPSEAERQRQGSDDGADAPSLFKAYILRSLLKAQATTQPELGFR
jgi:hypothetical protein